MCYCVCHKEAGSVCTHINTVFGKVISRSQTHAWFGKHHMTVTIWLILVMDIYASIARWPVESSGDWLYHMVDTKSLAINNNQGTVILASTGEYSGVQPSACIIHTNVWIDCIQISRAKVVIFHHIKINTFLYAEVKCTLIYWCIY